jgi:undecaprenyl-diphosphatase
MSPISMFQAAVLGVLQGVTELFPISSLGHTVLFPTLFGWHNVVKVQSQPESFWLAFVVMLHVGSAIGLLIFFWRDWVDIVRAWFRTLARRRIETSTERLAWLIIVATIPTGILGVALEHTVRVALAKPLAAALFLIVNGFILFAGERARRRSAERTRVQADDRARGATSPAGPAGEHAGRELATLQFREAAVLGVAQSSALIAGISRDGVCMSAGLARGLNHEDSARFAFLLATPIILAAGLYKIPDLTGPLGNGIRGQALLGAACAAVASYFSVRFLVNYFKTKSLMPFAIYCVAFGAFMAVYASVT